MFEQQLLEYVAHFAKWVGLPLGIVYIILNAIKSLKGKEKKDR